MQRPETIFLSGGGTLGSVTPLFAVGEELKKQNPDTYLQWIGTRKGPEQEIIAKAKIPFHPIWSGKLRRYFSFRNFFDPLFMLFGFFQSICLIVRYHPKVILSAGGYVSVPLVWAGWLLGVPSLIHQQDLRPGLANRLMAPFAKRITVAYGESLKFFPKSKAVLTGNPVRPEILQGDRTKALSIFHLEKDLPTLLVLGGGTGAMFLNTLVGKSLSELLKFCQVIHLAGRNKSQVPITNRYHPYEFLTFEMSHAFATADLIVSRAGLGTLSELAALGKPAIIVPIKGTHQEENAKFFGNSSITFSESILTPERFVSEIKNLFGNKNKLEQLGQRMKGFARMDAATVIASETLRIIG